ncbi:MAG TPA: ATP-binding protein [Candidatus Binatia bacterium]|nr:ATP-binding protein [Candidatus Binatia bacterium]
MLDLRHSPISRKLTWMNVLVSGAALLAACVAFFIYDQYSFREALIRSLSAQAQIIGSNSVSALIFNDPHAAEDTLSALRNLPNITAAGIFTADGRLFAHYYRNPGEQLLNFPEGGARQESHVFRSDEVYLRQPIIFQGRQLGAVFIRSDLSERTQRLKRYATIAAAVLLLSLLAALLVSSLFRRSVAAPIVQLAETARMVSEDRNYSVRAAPTGKHDEVAVLIEAFNTMLAQIQQRDAELQTARDQLEQRVEERTRQLVAANRELEAFSYSVSHDLRAPLEVINGFSHMLTVEHAGELDASAQECVQQINMATRRMAELIDDLLNLSHVSTASMHREQVNLSGMARAIADQLCRQEPGRSVEFQIQDCAPVEGDSRLLRIVLENLMSNAWKYTAQRQPAHIAFGCEQRRGRTIFFVRDDGAGFDPALADRLFKPFQRLHAKSEFPGTGIGLATVQRIIARHGGEVWATGAVQKGATFHFSL